MLNSDPSRVSGNMRSIVVSPQGKNEIVERDNSLELSPLKPKNGRSSDSAPMRLLVTQKLVSAGVAAPPPWKIRGEDAPENVANLTAAQVAELWEMILTMRTEERSSFLKQLPPTSLSLLNIEQLALQLHFFEMGKMGKRLMGSTPKGPSNSHQRLATSEN